MSTGAEPVQGTAVAPSRKLRFARQVAPSTLAALIVVSATTVPTLYLLIRASQAGLQTTSSILLSARTAGLLLATGFLTVSVTITAVAVAVPLAWLVTSTDLPFRRVIGTLAPLPLAIPSYVAGFAFVAAFGPRGFLQAMLSPFGVDRIPEVYGFLGAWMILSLITYPYVFLAVRGALDGLDPSIEEAARTLGETTTGVLRRVILPSLKPITGVGALLVALYTLHDFGAVSLLRFDTFTRAIYVSYRGSYDRSGAAVLSLVLVALSLIAVALERSTRKRASYHRVHLGGGMKRRTVELGRWRWPLLAACSGLLWLALGVPVVAISYWLVKGVQGGRAVEIAAPGAWSSMRASMTAAVLVTAAAIPVAIASMRHRSRLAGILAAVPYTGYALPGVVVALGVVFLGIRTSLPLYQTQAMLMFGYLILFLPLAIGPIRSSLLQFNPRLEEAARTLGRKQMTIYRKVVYPLVKPGLLTGFALVFLTTMKELPATLLLAPPGFRTLATQVWSATAAASFARAAPPALLLVLLSAIPMAFLIKFLAAEELDLTDAS